MNGRIRAQQVGLALAPAFGERGSFIPLGLAYLNGALRSRDFAPAFFDTSAWVREEEPELYAQLSSIGFSPHDGGFFGPDLPLLLQIGRPQSIEARALACSIVLSAKRSADRILSATPQLDLLGITLWDSNLYYALALGRALGERGVRVVLGGPGAHLPMVRELLLRLSGAWAIVVGEGEERFVALAEGESPQSINGCATLDAAGAMIEGLPAPALRIHEIAEPSFEGFDSSDWLPVLTSRGCIRDCSFCTEAFFWQRYRQRRVEDVLAELSQLVHRYGTRRFEFNDDLLNGHPRWLERFCDGLIERRWGLRWICFMEPYRLTPALLDKLAAAGCTLVKYGVQHFHPEMLATMGRGEGVSGVIDTLIQTARRGIRVDFDLVPGHPGETLVHHQENLDRLPEVLGQAPGMRVNVNPFLLLHGSPVEQHPERYGVKIRRQEPQDFGPALAGEFGALLGQFIAGYSQSPTQEKVRERTASLDALAASYQGRALCAVGTASPSLSNGAAALVVPGPNDTARSWLAALARHGRSGMPVVGFVNAPALARPEVAQRAVALGARIAAVPISLAHGGGAESVEAANNWWRAGARVWALVTPHNGGVGPLLENIPRLARAGASVLWVDYRRAQLEEPAVGLFSLVEAANAVGAAAQRVGISVLEHGLPFCLAADAAGLARQTEHGFDDSAGWLAQPNAAFMQPARCRACRLSMRCPGVLRATHEREGDSFLRPLGGRPQDGGISPIEFLLEPVDATPRATEAALGRP